LRLPDPGDWNGKESMTLSTEAGGVELVWLAVGLERDWAASGTTRPPAAQRR
jgi:hypothetical protein